MLDAGPALEIAAKNAAQASALHFFIKAMRAPTAHAQCAFLIGIGAAYLPPLSA